jgi:hypothetical protein
MAINQAPFDPDGNMMGYPEGWRKPEMRTVEPFAATMTLVGMYSGRSAKGFYVKDTEGHCYPVFAKDMLEMFKGAEIPGMWAVSKRGQNYGIKRIDVE